MSFVICEYLCVKYRAQVASSTTLTHDFVHMIIHSIHVVKNGTRASMHSTFQGRKTVGKYPYFAPTHNCIRIRQSSWRNNVTVTTMIYILNFNMIITISHLISKVFFKTLIFRERKEMHNIPYTPLNHNLLYKTMCDTFIFEWGKSCFLSIKNKIWFHS